MNQKEKKFWRGAASVSTGMMGTLVIFTGAVAGFFFLTRPWWRKYKKWDLDVFKKLEPHTNSTLTKAMEGITFLGKHQFLIPAHFSLIGYFLFIHRRTWFSIRVLSIGLSSLGMLFALKYLFHRRRPSNPVLKKVKSTSFPSGHAIMSVSFYGLLIYIVINTIKEKRIKFPVIVSLALLIQLISFSRIYLRVHYTSDVLAGYIIGSLWLFIALKRLNALEEYNKKRVMFLEPYSA